MATIQGTSDDDTLTGGDEPDRIIAAEGDDLVSGAALDDVVLAGIGADTVYGNAGDDILQDDIFVDNGGDDWFYGGDGADRLFGEGGYDRLYGEAGDDYIDGAAGGGVISGAAGNDRIRQQLAEGTSTLVYGGEDNDSIDISGVGSGATIDGGDGGDEIRSSDVALIMGGAGDDLLIMFGHSGLLDGGRGADFITTRFARTATSSPSVDPIAIDLTIVGGVGDDELQAGYGVEDFDGGVGRDRVNYWDLTEAVSVDLSTGRGAGGGAQGDSYRGVESATGGRGADILTGNAADNALDGRLGDDSLFGGEGTDRLTGGLGRDELVGGKNADRFIFQSAADSPDSGERDVILDFVRGDKIKLSSIDADPSTNGKQSFVFIGSAMFSGAAGELRYSGTGDGVIVYANTDSDLEAEFSVQVNGVSRVTLNDFVL